MRLTDASVAIRPRSAWEALDLGVLLARRHAGLLTASWAAVTLPIFVVLSLALWNYPGLAILLFWWLKPAFERLPLYILSRALFGDTPTLRESLRAFPGLLRRQLLPSLLWRRFSPTRSFDLPVQQLEGLKGRERSQRLIVLGQRNAAGATWLTVIGMHFEAALYLGLMALLYLLLPQQWLSDWKWQALLNVLQGDLQWLEHLANLLYAVALVVWEPVYVACGFSLYLNRRTELEAWDIELTFRRLRQRLIGSAYALLLLCASALLLLPTPSAWAAEEAGASSCPLPQTDPNGPDAPRLQHQRLSSEQSRQAAHSLLDAPPFRNRETQTQWQLGEAKEEKAKQSDADMKAFFDALRHWKPFEFIAQSVQALLWAALLALAFLLLWRYRAWLRLFAERLGLPQRAKREAPPVLFGLELTPESLPGDIAGEAERLWDEQPRAALGLLYRALLSRLLHDFRLPLRESTTEGEVLQSVASLQRPELDSYAQLLTGRWQDLAYGHRLPAANYKQALCDGWRGLFDARVTP
ncbi:hypothetical protein PKB_4694 [Pseudomonas knackmussii B13]|uniref:Protein-glutamine gamma-glutamyltransferase-like C-terminal domain-containing protein n=1 Tax=Pseudomonas knackmussii (strain DSM 6978 / CCUG 54928 / LMG 23759 / B13) TaxID=1301098 RepID=A0A024HNK9_PSEKB|nr:DUF4129 domain-containing protein [Pseudomonas knackmussii]CDF86018.1 hypothetical protein PKB_4694 [Pseudomonas knackmussii B13]